MSEPPLIDIRPDHWEIVRAILNKHVPDREVWAFGSRAKWTAKQYSDLDLAVLGDESLDLDVQAGLEEDFSESDLPFKVDVVDWATTAETFRGIIERDRVVVQRGDLVSRWRSTKWGNEISLEYGKGIRGYSDAFGKVRVFGTNGPVGWTAEPLAQGPGVILGRKGAYRSVHYSPDPFFVIDTAYYVLPKSDLDMRWIYYAIIYHKLGEIDDGSPIPSTTRAAVYVRDLEVPPLSEQRAIAQVLGALDDKIELNRCMNSDLEAMARVFFKDWFVDFGPVRAKAEGRPAYLAQEIWALFPDALDEEDKPVGWEVALWGNVAILEYGKRLTNYKDGTGLVPVFGTNGPIGWHTEALYHSEGIVIGRKGACRGVHFSSKPFFVIDTAFYLRPLSFISMRWAYYTILRYSMNEMDSGSAIPLTSREKFYRLETILPDKTVQVAFDRLLAPVWELQNRNSEQSQTLAKLRDLLLPKLITGEIRVRDAEKVVKAVL